MNKTSRHIILTIIFTITIIGCLPLNTSAGYLVQQGRTLLTSTQQDISITAVNDISRAFVIFNHYYAAGQLDQVESNSNNGEADVACTAAFLSAVNTIQVNRDSAASNVWIDWQVIECSNQEFEVFRDNYAWSDTDGNEITTAIGSTVTPADCLAWISGSTSSASNTTSYETILFRALVSSATEISIRRSGADAGITGSLRWIVVAFDPAKIDSIQTGTTTVTNTHVETAPQQVTITAVDISDSLLLFQMGVTSTGLDQCAVSGRLADTTTLEFYTRGTSTTIRDVRYYVIDFGPACGSRQAGTIDYSSNSGWYNHAQALSPAVTPGRTVTFTSLTQDGTGTAFVRPFPNAYIEDGSTYKIWRSRWGQESWIEWQVLELPEPLPPGFQQYSFRGRTDDADESAATWAAAADSGWTQNVDENFRIRFLVQETGGVPQDDKTFQLEYNWNETGWLDITAASSVIAASDSTFLTDGDDTTRQLGAGSFISVNGGIDEADGSAGGTVLDFSGSDQVELEFCLQIAGNDVYEGDTIQLRVKGLDGYTVVPELSVTGALVPETDGGVAVYREETASENYTSTSPVAVEWDTNVLVDTATFSRTGTAILLKERGHYLATWSMVGDESGDDRAKLEGLLELEGQQLAYGRGWGYLRDSADATESYAQGATIINAGLNDELILKVFRQETNTGAQGWVRRSSSSGIALIKLNEGWDYARYREAVGGQNIYFPEASKVTIDLDTTDEQDAPFSRGSGAVTIADSGIYMVTFNLGLNHNGTGGRKNGVAALYLNSSEVPGTRVTGYVRDSNGDLEGGLSYIGLITVSANDILTIQAWCDLGDATGELTIDGSTTAVTLARLPEAADFLQLHEAGGGQDLALTSTNITFDTNDRVDSASFSRSGAEDEIIVNHTDEYLVTWSVFAQTPDTSTVREEILTQLSVNGAVVPYGTAGNFIRAAQGGVNCLAGGASMGTVLSLQQNDIIRLVQQNEGGDSTAVFEANRVALQATRISSLFSSSAGYLTVSGAASMNAGDSNELTITAYTSEGAVDTAYSGDKTLTFSGPSTAPNGSVPTVEGVNVGAAITVSFTGGVSDAGAATLIAGKAEFNNVDTTDGTITTTGSSARDLDLTVSHGSVEHFTYLQQPSNSRPNDTLTGTILELLDAYNNRCTNASSSVTLSIGTNPVAGTLSGTTIQTPASGTVLFDDLSIDSLGSGYTLQASTSGATTATSDSFSITSDAPSSFGYRKLITIDYTRIGSSCASSLSNFPLLVSLAADNNLKSVVNGGHVENNEGRDIIFRQDDGIVELDHEIESYNPVSGDLDAWVRIPDLAHNQNTSIYIYYGNSDVTESTQNAATVWDANHAGVWHLDESGSGQNNEFTDSTANDNSGQGGGGNSVLVPTQTSGAVDDGQDFDGTGDYIDCGSGTSLDLKASSMTAECWLKYDSPPSSRMCVFSKGGETDGYRIFLEIDGTISFDLTGQTYSLSSAAALTQGSWQHVAARYNGSDMRLWLNGTLDSNRLNRPPSINSSTANLLIGRDAAGSSPFNGGIDELRISGSARTSCWIETAYNSQSSPGTFCTIGAEEAGPPTAIKLNSFTAEPYQGLVILTWETGHEIKTAGFHLYRISPEGLRHRITDSIIPAAISSVQGHEYNYYDEDAEPADRPCYLLEEITLAGSRSLYGPYCVSSAPLQNISDRAAFPAIAPSDDTATLRASASSAADAAALPSQAAIKIAVSTDGWYLIAQPELIAAGLTPSSNPRFFQLYADGKEIPIQVSGSIDGSFDPQDTIAFYGMALDTKYSDTQTYWLTEGSSSGKRIKCSFGLGFRPAPPAYPAILEHKERSFYFSSLKNNSQNKFFGELVWTDPISILLATNSPVSAASSDALLEVTLQGASDATHSVSMILNDQEIGDFSFEGQTSATSSLSINHDLIRDGANTLILTSLNGENDISMVDTIRLTYQRTYTVSEDLIKCSAAGGQRLSLQGFTNDDITVVDITDPLSPLIITSRVSRRGSSYTAALTAPRTGLRSLYAVDNAAALHPERITMNHPSALTDPSTAADMIIISTPELMDSIQPLKDYRESQDYSVVLIDLEDIYDEFSFGNASPLAIKDFLFFSVKNWDTPPAAVLLIGDASYDPRNYFSLSSENLLPTRLIETDYLETASDDWFVDFDNDTLPDLAVGRIPAGSADDAEIIIDKIIAYESTVEALSTALAVAGQNDEFDYTSASTDIADMLRASLEVEEIIYSQSSSPHDDFLDGFNTGPLLINYIGHASTALWTGGLFAATDVAALSNRPDFPFVVSMTCLNGYFIDPEYASLAEILLNTENGGALAVWTSSGLTDPRAQIDMNKELLNLLLQDELIPLGEAVRQAKSAADDEDVRKTWILFGDPLTKLRKP